MAGLVKYVGTDWSRLYHVISCSWQGGDVYVTADTLFTNNKGMQNIGLMPAVQQASAVFSGRRNPNERRNNRKHWY